MKFEQRCLPMGTLPYNNVDAVSRMMLKLFEKIPFLPHLPAVDHSDTLAYRTLNNMPGFKVKGNNISLKADSEQYKKGLVKLDKAFNNPTMEALHPYSIHSAFIEKFLQIIAKTKAPHACVNLMGPFTISQRAMGLSGEQFLLDKSFRKLFIQSVAIKALWVIEQIKLANPTTVPIIILEEPSMAQIGVIKKDNEDITTELITTMISRVVEKLKAAGAMVAIHCMDKCDWTVAINAGVDIISFDAYNNPNNLSIIPEQLKEYIANGGKVNWCIMPVMTEAIVKNMNIDTLTRRLVATMEGLVNSGIPPKYVYNTAFVSLQGDVDKLPIIIAEKALILTSQLTKRIPVVG